MYYLFIKISYITHAMFSKLLGSTGYRYAIYIKYLLTCMKLYSETRSVTSSLQVTDHNIYMSWHSLYTNNQAVPHFDSSCFGPVNSVATSSCSHYTTAKITSDPTHKLQILLSSNPNTDCYNHQLNPLLPITWLKRDVSCDLWHWPTLTQKGTSNTSSLL